MNGAGRLSNSTWVVSCRRTPCNPSCSSPVSAHLLAKAALHRQGTEYNTEDNESSLRPICSSKDEQPQ